MKLKEMLDLVSKLTDAERSEQLKQYKQLKKTLKQLSNKSKELEEAIASEPDPELRKKLEDKFKIVSTQRRKGLDLLKELRELPRD